MPPTSTLLAFAGASLALIVLPGPNLIYIVTCGASRGRQAGIVSAAGVETATLIHVSAAVLGLSTLVASSRVAYATIVLAGAGYLVYLAVRALRAPIGQEGAQEGRDAADAAFPTKASTGPKAPPVRRVYLDGVLVNLLNPKVGLFFLVYLSQFVSPHEAAATARAQMLVLGSLFFLLALACDLAYAMAGAALAGRLSAWPAQRFVAAAVYACLGGYAVISLLVS